jgi:tRNA threonylcarbamoyladenosine biosynthesis protein TsaE
MEKIYKIKSLEETQYLAESIAEILKPGQVVTLKGTLGAGKTFFTSCIINKLLGKKTEVLSPTFNIVKEYETNYGFSIYHFDLYRLKNKRELYELDIENCFENGISIIEWSEKAEGTLYNVAIEIEIEIIGENERAFRVLNLS